MQDACLVLQDELDRYNNHQVHSTTKETPNIRFEKAKAAGNYLFRPFYLPKSYTSPEDVFCLRLRRRVNRCRRVSLLKHRIQVPNARLREYVDLHLVPDPLKQII